MFEWTKTFVNTTFNVFKTALFDGGLDPFSKTARKNAWDDFAADYRKSMRNFDPTRSGTKTNNALKIDAGWFMHIPLWESGQTLLGSTISHFRNMTGQVDNVELDWKHFAVLVNDKDSDTDSKWGFTLGPYINSKNIEVGSDIYKHEVGHTIQSRLLGPLYLQKVAIPSLISFTFMHDKHENTWFEVWASRLGGAPNHNKDYRHDHILYWAGVALLPIFPF